MFKLGEKNPLGANRYFLYFDSGDGDVPVPAPGTFTGDENSTARKGNT